MSHNYCLKKIIIIYKLIYEENKFVYSVYILLARPHLLLVDYISLPTCI